MTNSGKTTRLRYETPTMVVLGELAAGHGACEAGSGDVIDCTAGPYASQDCSAGATATRACTAGESARVACTAGTIHLT